jgi:hypothetical protein
MNNEKTITARVQFDRYEVLTALQMYYQHRLKETLFIPDIIGSVDLAMGPNGNVMLTITTETL